MSPPCSSRRRTRRRSRGRFSGTDPCGVTPWLSLTPFAEHEPTQGESEPEGPNAEGADRRRLAPVRKALPAAEGFLLLIRQRLAAALFAHRAARAQAEVEIVEDLGGFVGHVIQCTSLLRRCPQGSSTSLICMSAPSRSRRSRPRWAL